MKPKFDYTKGEFVNTFGDMGMDWDGNLIHRISDDMAIDENGDLRIIPNWEENEFDSYSEEFEYRIKEENFDKFSLGHDVTDEYMVEDEDAFFNSDIFWGINEDEDDSIIESDFDWSDTDDFFGED